ncbi:FG-GAP-like repeat-containing protein [Bacteroides sp.]
MKVQITTWIFLLLMWSGFSSNTVNSQTVINEFPYTLNPHDGGWELSGGEWGNLSPIVQGYWGTAFTLSSPQIALPEGGGMLILKGIIHKVYGSTDGKTYDLLLENKQMTEKTHEILLSKNIQYLKISSDAWDVRIDELNIQEFTNILDWVVNSDTYTLAAIESSAGQTAIYWLPVTSISTKTIITFDITGSSLENVDLFFVEMNSVGKTVETPITTANGKVKLDFQTAAMTQMTPGFKAVSKGGKIPEITISNVQIKVFRNNPNMQFDLSYWYDEDRDGLMEFYLDGMYKIENGKTPVKYHDLPEGTSSLRPYNVNNDKAIDYLAEFYKAGIHGYSYYKIYTNDEQGECKISQKLGNEKSLIPCDYNNDGIVDFLLPDGTVAVQFIDGSFQIHKLELFTQEEYLNRDKTNDEWNPEKSHSGNIIVQNRNDAFLSGKDMFIGGNGKYVGSMGYQTSNIDFNKDGYPDIVNTSTGQILLYAAQDKYIILPMGGAIYFRDLNNDQRTDYVVYEPDTKTVTAHIYQADGTEKTQQLISNMSMDQQVWCYDFDKDGDIDILLPFSYQESNGAAFLVVMENDGKGNFKMHETAFDEMIQFVACADIDHDGYYDVIATYAASDKSSEDHAVFLLKGNNKMQYQMQPEPLIQLEKRNNKFDCNVQVADINNDGYYDIMVQYQTIDNSKQKNSLYVSEVYSAKDLLPDISANQAPQKLEKPTYLFEPSTGFLKVNWQPGKDAESSSADLTYALRIGTEPGKGDIYYAHATEDGRRLNLLDGNMGYDLDRILDASGWAAGKYYIAIQAIDPMHSGSAWSEEAVFEKPQLTSTFHLSDGRTVEDTITLALTTPINPTLEYKWDFSDATIISKNETGSVYQLKFPTPGKKRISLQTSNARGEISTTTDKQIFIFANRLINESWTLSSVVYGISGAIDMDNDGIVELLTDNGVFENDGKGNYTKIKKIYNTNLSFHSRYDYGMYVADLNKDGLADILFSSYNGSNSYVNHHMNQGEKTLATESHDGYSVDANANTTIVDLNNDGYMDYIDEHRVRANAGDDLSFNDLTLESVSGNWGNHHTPILLMADLDKDGFYDGINNCLYKANDFPVYFYMNNGDNTFQQKEVPITDISFIPEDTWNLDISAIADMNNDGYTDLIIKKNDQTILILVNNKNESFDKVIEVTMPRKLNDFSISKIYDYDNNGYLDITLGQGYTSTEAPVIIYFYDEWKSQVIYGDGLSFGGWFLNIDANNDGVTDFVDSQYGYIKNCTTVSNTRPQSPTNIRSTQTPDFVTLQWDAAKDAETPYTQMRYNISVKKQGATGAGAFVISPMNDLKAEAAIVPRYTYPSATTYSIPLSVLPAGNYEVQIQAIDGWDATSPFSDVYTLKVEANPQMQVPVAVCAGSSATVTYTGNASASGLTWNWDGGQLLYQDKNNYDVVWDTEGEKQISVTSDGVTSTSKIWVSPAIDPTFSINAQALLYSETPLTLPEGDYEYAWEISKNGSEFKALSEYKIPPVKFVRNGNTNQAKATFMSTGNYVLRLLVYAPCGTETCDRSVAVTDALSRQEINLVTVDPTTGKYSISWQYPTELPSFVNNVNIYKEGNKYNDFHLLATVPTSQTSYIDMTSNPQIGASRYRLTLQTNYGAETTAGTPHQGVHVMINKGIGNGWNIIWSQYEGATIETYRILRGATPESLSVVAEVSGNATSYSDVNAPAGTLYYALDFDAKYEDTWKPMQAMRQTRANQAVVRSNIVSTSGASNVIFAEDIMVRSIEEAVLSPEQTAIHMVADIYPLTATYRAINWTVVSGNDIASIDQNGVLTAKGDKNGTVVVRATAIDGSGIYTDTSVTTDGLTSINELKEDGDNIIAYPSPVTDILHIKNMPEGNGSKNKLYVINLNGQLLHSEETAHSETTISCGSYPTGIYILKIVTEKKVITRQFMKKQ